jgi:ribose transport system permease protein
MQPFIVTLCGLLFYRGIARFVANDETKGFGNSKGFEGLKDFATGSLFGLPMPLIILLILSVVMGVILHRSVWGRHLFAAGRNEEAARYSGINTARVIGSTYVLSGFLAAVAGILIAFYTNSISPSSHGNFYELYGIAAAVLGGCSLRGGEGSIVGILLGAILLQVLQNLVNLLGIPSSLNFAVMGAVILIGVLADQLLSRRAAARQVKA